MSDRGATLALEGGDAALAQELATAAERAGCTVLPASSHGRATVLLVAGDGQASALDRVRAATRLAPGRPVAVVAEGNLPTPLEAMAAGARWVLTRPLATPDLAAAIAALGAADESGPPRVASARVLVLLGASGGCGTTTCAAALAAGLDAVLVDLDLALGDAAEVAGIAAPHREALVELACAPAAGGGSLGLGASPRGAGRVLAAPARPEHADLVDERGAARVLDALEAECPVLVVDAGSRVGVETIPALERATAIVIVAPSGLRGTRGAARQASLLARLGLGATPIGLVVTGTRDRRAAACVADETGVPLWAVVGADRAIPRAGDRGVAPPPKAFAATLARVAEALA